MNYDYQKPTNWMLLKSRWIIPVDFVILLRERKLRTKWGGAWKFLGVIRWSINGQWIWTDRQKKHVNSIQKKRKRVESKLGRKNLTENSQSSGGCSYWHTDCETRWQLNGNQNIERCGYWYTLNDWENS